MFRDITVKGVKYHVCIGDKFNRLEIVEFTTVKEKNGGRLYNRVACYCKCDCGNDVGPIALRRVVSGNDKSCGCLDHENLMQRNTKHGFKTRSTKRDQLYDCWVEIHRRCRDTERKSAKYYSLKGIEVCEEWVEFLPFREWALSNGFEYNCDLSIERKDNSKGYNPDNCIWISKSEQSHNISTNVNLEYNGETHCVAEWCRITGKSRHYIMNRIKAGKSVGEALGYE